MIKHRNSYNDLIEFFSTPEKPVSVTEFGKFTRSLTNDERDYYMYADIMPRKSNGTLTQRV